MDIREDITEGFQKGYYHIYQHRGNLQYWVYSGIAEFKDILDEDKASLKDN